VTVITLNPKLLFVTGHLHSATWHARDVEAVSQNRSYKTIVPDTNRSRRILRSRRLHDVNPVKVVPWASPFASMIFYKRWSSFFSFLSLSFFAGYHIGCVRRLHSSSLSPSFRPSTTTCGNSPITAPPTPYGGVTNDSTVYEYGLFRWDRYGEDYHEQTPFRIRTKKNKKVGHKNVRVIFHLHACRNLNLFFLLLLQLRSGFLFSIIRAQPFGFQDRWLTRIKDLNSTDHSVHILSLYHCQILFLNKLYLSVCIPPNKYQMLLLSVCFYF